MFCISSTHRTIHKLVGTDGSLPRKMSTHISMRGGRPVTVWGMSTASCIWPRMWCAIYRIPRSRATHLLTGSRCKEFCQPVKSQATAEQRGRRLGSEYSWHDRLHYLLASGLIYRQKKWRN